MNAKWKRLVTAILMMALLLGPIVSMQTPARAADGEDDNTFIVGFDAEFPPYGYKDDNGEYVGFDLDLAQEVCDRNGWTLKKQPIEWNSKDMELNSGSISCIWNGFTMNGREDAYTWTTPYVDNSQVVVVRKDSGITQLNDLSGKVVAVQADSSALAALTGEDASEAGPESVDWGIATASTMDVAYADVREDRVVLHATATRDIRTFAYRIKATNAGRFAVPPAYAESLYDRTVQARSQAVGANPLVVTKP